MQLPRPASAAEALRQHWAQLWALVLAAPAVLALTSMSAAMGAAAIVVTLGLAAVTMTAMTAEGVRVAPAVRATAVRFAVCTATTCLGFGGLFAYSGQSTWAIVAVYVTTAVWALATRGAEAGRPAASDVHTEPTVVQPAVATPAVAADDLRDLSDAELCRAWRRSFLALMSAADPAGHEVVVLHRQALLDEMEQRDPAGLQAWLSSGARAASGPERYLGRDDPAGPRNVA